VTHRPPAPVVWGKGDEIFGPQGALAFAQDVPGAEIHLLDGGHLLLEGSGDQVADLMLDLLDRSLSPAG
jgi:pimeloyl-ACP methyl ester carboxylesterase